MFGFSPLASTAFNSLRKVVTSVTPYTWGQTGGVGKKKKGHIAQSKRSEIKEYLAAIFAEPVVEEEMLEALQPYAKEEVTPNAIDYDLLLNSVEMVQNIIARAQAIQQEHEDEELLLMLI